MTDSNYDKLLDSLYAKLPAKAVGTVERFEYPKFECFTEGTKTFIKNFDAVVSKLRRDKVMLIKFLSKELAVPIVQDADRVVLQRRLVPESLNSKLDDFTTKYVICKECKKPDTNIIDGEHGFKQVVCEACGARSSVK